MSDQESAIHAAGRPRQTTAARGATLEGFAEAAGGPGVALHGLAPLTSLFVHTRNTRYHIVVSCGDEIFIQGGRFFPDPTPAHLEGATLGSSLLKVGWIGVGLRMEIRAGGQRIVTTAVHSIVRGALEPGSRTH